MRALALTGLLAAGCIGPDPTSYPAPEGDYGSTAGGWDGYVGYVAGVRRFGSDFGDARDAVVPGALDLTLTPPGSPISFALQLAFSYVADGPDESVTSSIRDIDSVSSTRLDVGLRHVFGEGAWRPFVGGGVSFLDVVFEDTSAFFGATDRLDADQSLGAWAGGGLFYSTQGGFTIGTVLQQTFGHEMRLAGRDFDADSLDVLLFLGTRF